MIVSIEQLKDYMSGIGLRADQEQAAEMVLAGIQADLEHYLHRPLEPRTITEYIKVRDDGIAMTTHDPIISTTHGGFMVRGQRLRSISGIGVPSTWTLASLGEEWVEVTYTYGYDARPEIDVNNEFADVRLAILRVASREVTNRHDDTLSVKGLETDNVGEPTGPQNGVQGWTMDELRQFDRLRKRVIV